MASNPPFELEDTDEDFFDKLVNDDDDDVGVGVGGGLKSVESMKAFDVSEGNDSDELKGFANLSVSDGSNVNDDSVAPREIGGNDSVGEVHDVSVSDNEVNEVKPTVNLSTSGGSDVNEASELPQVVGQRMEAVEQPLVDQGAVHSSLSETIVNGHSSEYGVLTPQACSALSDGSAGGVKEVQWSSFSGSGELDDPFGSYSDLLTDLGGGVESLRSESKTVASDNAVTNTMMESSYGHVEYQDENRAVAEQSMNGADMNSTEYWENLYPGWKYDANTGQWYQVDGTTNTGENFASVSEDVQGETDAVGDNLWAISDVQTSQVSNAQQTAQSAIGTVSQFSTTDHVLGQDQHSQQYGQYQYPAHMIFDPQYPGWYYDTIVQEWRSLETYHSSSELMNQIDHQQTQNGFLSSAGYSHDNINSISGGASQDLSSASPNQNWAASSVNYSEQNTNVHHSGISTESWSAVGSGSGQLWQSSYDSNVFSNSHLDQHKSPDFGEMVTSHHMTNQIPSSSEWVGGQSHSFGPTSNTFQQFNHIQQGEQKGPVQYPDTYYGSQNAPKVSQPSIPNGYHIPYAPSEGRSSAGRPPHALVTFGFGGKLVVMKDASSHGFSSLSSKESHGCSISVLSLMEIVNNKNGISGTEPGACGYIRSLCHQSFPGPLVGGNAGSKELYKWIDDKITNCDSLHMDHGKGEAFKLLFSLLKVVCQRYGKLRSNGMDTGMMENDLPESAVATLFASAKRNGGQFSEYDTVAKCFMHLPSEAQIQATATEVQNLLICGRKKDALQCAQEGQLWSFALILARELGDQYYADTVKQMAVSQLVVGSPLRTLCLLIAKKPEEVFSANVMAAGNLPGALHVPPLSAQNAGYSMLDNWEENLAVITANRTENDHLVITHLGDCLWKEKYDVIAAHTCYLVAEAEFELYSDSARLCLIGADHWNFPRTYASPEAIQRTELFEYSKVLGNSQFVLLPLQPYKLIYAHMLAEVGRLSDSLKYCQAVYKSLKTVRSPEADTLKQLVASLEDRIRTHQQSGYAANLAPAKIVGKLLNFFDNTAQRVTGGLPPPVPATTQGSIQGNEHQFQTLAPMVSSSQSTMAIPSLMPSASMEPISQWAVDGSKMTIQNRSISEPNIGRIPKPDQVDSAKETNSSSSDGKQSGTKTSRFGRLGFGAQILQKTVGLVLKPRQGRQAKLGETNKFYYDEKLKRWVEEGAEQPAEETALPPPPTTAAFSNGTPDYSSMNASTNVLHAADFSPESTSSVPLASSSGIPAIPPSSNQFSGRGRMGVRSRYVDTFNKGGGASPNLFQTPSVPSAKPSGFTAANFFIPTAAPSNEQSLVAETGTLDEAPKVESSVSSNDPFQNLAPAPAATMQRFPSVDNIPNKRMAPGIGNSSLSYQSRRTASWNEIHNNAYVPPTSADLKASPVPFMPGDSLPASQPMNSGNFGNDLQEVKL